MPPPKLLIVEDEIIIARDIAAQLVALGYTPVGHATTGQQSIDMARTLQPDLVLMDIQLVGPMDGIAAAQTIRDDFFIPVVFVSAFSADATIARAKLTEPYGYILKPFSERGLAAGAPPGTRTAPFRTRRPGPAARPALDGRASRYAQRVCCSHPV